MAVSVYVIVLNKHGIFIALITSLHKIFSDIYFINRLVFFLNPINIDYVRGLKVTELSNHLL